MSRIIATTANGCLNYICLLIIVTLQLLLRSAHGSECSFHADTDDGAKSCDFQFTMAKLYDIELYGPGIRMLLNPCEQLQQGQCHPADCKKEISKTDYTLPGEPSPTCKPYDNVPDLTTGRMIFYSLQDKPINQKCFDNSNNNTVDCTEACSVMVHGKNSRENTLAVPVVKLETHGRAGYYLEVKLYSLQAYKQLRIDPTEKTKFLKE